jgi:hypothetical protein
MVIVSHVASAVIASGQTPLPPAGLPEPPSVQLTPFSALGDDYAPGGGVALTYFFSPSVRIEVEGSLSTDAARSGVSLLYGLPRWGCCSVYLAGGVGVQRDQDPDYFGPGIRKKTEPAWSIGTGMTVPLVGRFAYRFDFRWYNPDNEWPESWRIYHGLAIDWRR